jgi:predicted nucleic acid-binding protein
MILYWDSSSLIAALIAGHQPKGLTRTHTLAEVFSTLTGKGIETAAGRQRLYPDDAAALLSNLPRLKFVDLTPGEALKALESAETHGVRGGLVHDWLHVQAAHKAEADLILTENTQHFRTLTKVPLETFEGKFTR